MDLVALNIQRGRDHGLPGYNAFRELCGLGRVHDFDYLADIIPSAIVERLKMIYRDADDIDLFIGGIVETSGAGPGVGGEAPPEAGASSAAAAGAASAGSCSGYGRGGGQEKRRSSSR